MRTTISLMLTISLATSGAAQQPCTYRDCGLRIAPTWNGLALERGLEGVRVANLNFFVPRDVTRAFAGPRDAMLDSAAHHARRAARLRRIGAALTDAGFAVSAYAAVRAAFAGRPSSGSRRAMTGGALLLGASLPFHFAADGALSRAVWWHGARFAR